MPVSDGYQDAIETVRRTLQHLQGCTPEEREALLTEWGSLSRMAEKLETGRVDVALFGEISSGKSALINALVGRPVAEVNVQGGWTREIWDHAWDGAGHTLPGLAESALRLLDTPGINEIDDQGRARLAMDAARRSDLILFVTDADLNAREFDAITALATANKPMILVFNKVDLYSREQRDRILDVLRAERLPHVIGPQDIVMAAADPLEREVVIERADGTSDTVWRKPPPQVDSLKVRILQVLDREGKALLALNASLFAADTSDRVAQVRVDLRDRHAQRVIWGFAGTKAVAVASNPVPLLDVGGGLAVDATMVVTLADVYGLPMARQHAASLVLEIAKSAGWTTLAEWTTHLVSGALKATTFGAATALTALPQGLAAGYGSYIVGQGAKVYLERGASWGDEGPKTVVRRILEAAERDSIMERLRDQVLRSVDGQPRP